MNKSVPNALFIIFIATLLVVSFSFIVIGAKNISDSKEMALMIEPSGIYEQQGFTSLEEWKESFEATNRNYIFIGIGLFILAVVIVAIKRKQRPGMSGG